jgi:hypothetical protein
MASFADYVKDLMGVLPTVNGNPMLSATPTTDDNARYREDPFYKSRDIQARDQLVLDEEERKRKEAEMLKSNLTGVNGDTTTANTGSWMDVQPGETSAQRDSRISAWAQENPMQASLLGMAQGLFGKSYFGQLQDPSFVQEMSLQNMMNRAQTAQANRDYASIGRQAALDAAKGTALGTTGYGLYNQSTNSGDWSWVDNMNDSTFAGMMAGMTAADTAGNDAAAAAMERDFGISGADI